MDRSVRQLRILAVILFFGFAVGFAVLFLQDSAGGNSDLDKAVRFVKVHSSDRFIRTKSVFLNMDTAHTAENWVGYFFSIYSTRDWITDKHDLRGAVPRGPIKPSGIALVPHEVNPDSRRPQLVVTADNDRSMIIVEAYDHPAGPEPLFTREWEFPSLD